MTLWLADRSRYQRQHNQCTHARFLEYHSGPYGYGLRAKAETVYLPTGIYLHRIVADGLELAHEHGWVELLPDYRSEFRELIHQQITRYYALIEKRGIRTADSTQETLRIMKEQATLIEGIGWVWAETVLPFLVEHFTLESIEAEETYVIGCTCELPMGVGTMEDHEARECQGTGWMSAADCVLRRRSDGAIGWWETKTGANVFKKSWTDQWEHNVQFASGILGAERRIGEEISHYYVCGFQKGSRRSAKYDADTGTYGGPRLQDSFLCYLHYKPADPPLEEEDFRHKYSWTEVDPMSGTTKNRRLSRKYTKTPVWEIEFPGKPEEMSNIEYWCSWLGREELSKLINVVGPFERPTRQLEEFVEEAASSEKDWQLRLWRVYDARQAAYARLVEANVQNIVHELIEVQPEVQAAVRANFPKNWEGCKGYYGDNCEFLKRCLKEAGWDDPLGNGFTHRRPHHEPEVEQMRARGIPVPEEEDALDFHEE